jgi:hypothetical protein
VARARATVPSGFGCDRVAHECGARGISALHFVRIPRLDAAALTLNLTRHQRPPRLKVGSNRIELVTKVNDPAE